MKSAKHYAAIARPMDTGMIQLAITNMSREPGNDAKIQGCKMELARRAGEIPSGVIREIMDALARGADALDRMVRRALCDELNRRSAAR